MFFLEFKLFCVSVPFYCLGFMSAAKTLILYSEKEKRRVSIMTLCINRTVQTTTVSSLSRFGIVCTVIHKDCLV